MSIDEERMSVHTARNQSGLWEPPELQPWKALANCIGVDPGLFFSTRGHHAEGEQAKAVCRGCEVRLECLEYGLDEKFGVWGGLSERQRRQLRRIRRRGAA